MKKSSAFTRNICHKDQILNFEPPIIHFAAYVTGGLRKLYSQIHSQKASAFPQYEYGQFTDQSGQFITKKDCLLVSRYRVVEVIGTGSRGQSAVIVRAKDEFDGNKLVVIKVLHTNWRWLGAQEAHCLWKLQVADPYRASSTSRLLNIFMHDDHYCMVFEALCPEPLTSVFTDIPQDQVLPCIRKVTLRLLSTLGFLKQQNVIHADLKPENILLKKEGNLNTVTVIDFGNAMQHVFPEVSLYYKDFIVQTPLYRAPEVMFGIPFGTEIDMWSLGCILAELYKGTQLFHGTSKIPLIKEMSKLLGPFPLKVYQRGKFYSSLKQYTADIVQKDASVILEKKLSSHDYLFRDFLAGLLRYDPSERMTPYQAAQHPFLCSDLPLAFLLPSSKGKDLKPCNEYSFQPVKTYISANPCTESNEESSAITEDKKVLEDDKVIKKDDKITCRENRKTIEGKRSKGNVKTEFSTNLMEDDKNDMNEHNNLDFRRPLLCETFTVDTLKCQKEYSRQSSSENNRTVKCPSHIRRTGPNCFRINIPSSANVISKDIKEDKIQMHNIDRAKVLPECYHERGLKRKYLDSYETADYCPKQSLQDKITKIGNASDSKRTDSFDSDGNQEENSCTKFPDRFKRKSAERIDASKMEVSHHNDNSQFQFGSKPDLQSIMEAISREQEIVERDMKRKSEEEVMCRNVGTESEYDRQKKDNSHCSQGRNKEARTILPKGRAKCTLKYSGTSGSTENDSEDEFRTESSPICRSGITVSKRAEGGENREENIQKTKLSTGLMSAFDEQYDEVDAVQNPVFLSNHRGGGESRDHKLKKRSQNQDETLGNQCSDYRIKDTNQIQDVPVGLHSQDYGLGKNSHSQDGTSSSHCMPGERCRMREGKGGVDSRSQEEQVKYSTKTIREKKVISTGGEDVPRSQTTTRYKKEVKKRLMFSGALKSKKSHSVRTKKKSHKIEESRPYTQNRDGRNRTSELRHSSGSRKIRQQSGGGRNESNVGDPYRFTEDSPFKRHQHSNGICRNVDSGNNEHLIKNFANCTSFPKKSAQQSSGLSKSLSEDILLSYHQMHSSNEPGSIGQKLQIDSDRETDYMCRNTLSVDPRITKDKRNVNSSNSTTSNWQVKRTSEEKRPCVKEQSRKGVFASAYDSPQTDMEKKKRVRSHEKCMVRSPLSSGMLERNGKLSEEKYQVSRGVRKQESKGNVQTSCTYGSLSAADRGIQCTGHLRNDRGHRIHKLQKGSAFYHEGDIDEDCDISLIASPPSDCGVETYCKHNFKSRNAVTEKMPSDSDDELMLIE